VALPLGMLAVEGTLTHDLRVQKSRLSWRLCAAWDVGLHKLGRKQRLPSPLPRVKPALRWDVRTLAQPELEGCVAPRTKLPAQVPDAPRSPSNVRHRLCQATGGQCSGAV
jgi:hypothetical protein